jgi:hypothetical protein
MVIGRSTWRSVKEFWQRKKSIMLRYRHSWGQCCDFEIFSPKKICETFGNDGLIDLPDDGNYLMTVITC